MRASRDRSSATPTTTARLLFRQSNRAGRQCHVGYRYGSVATAGRCKSQVRAQTARVDRCFQGSILETAEIFCETANYSISMPRWFQSERQCISVAVVVVRQ